MKFIMFFVTLYLACIMASSATAVGGVNIKCSFDADCYNTVLLKCCKNGTCCSESSYTRELENGCDAKDITKSEYCSWGCCTTEQYASAFVCLDNSGCPGRLDRAEEKYCVSAQCSTEPYKVLKQPEHSTTHQRRLHIIFIPVGLIVSLILLACGALVKKSRSNRRPI